MKIGLYKLENYPNIAIEKLRIYHKQRGDIVVDFPSLEKCDVVYASSIFDFSGKFTVPYNAICGGTGFDVKSKLSPEVDAIKPHLNIGFTTRGCIRRCPFCVVPDKEGYIYIDGDLLDLWDGVTKDLTLYDNNILGLPEHFEYICKQAIEYGLRLDFNQGLDHRLLTPEIVQLMKSISHKEYRFAFDHPSYINTVENAIKLLQGNGINRCMWYVLVGFNTTFKQDLFRLNYLRDNNQNAYVQRYHKNTSGKLEYTALARWANQHHIFQGMTWKQFLNHKDNKRYELLLRD
jgi:hypothetical protein